MEKRPLRFLSEKGSEYFFAKAGLMSACCLVDHATPDDRRIHLYVF